MATKLLCVFSTLTCDNVYSDHKVNDNGVAVEVASVLVKGGAGVMNDRLVTPRGVATMVTEAQAELLKRNEVFKQHARNGFVVIDTVERPPTEADAENKAAAMESRDGSAPTVAEDFQFNGQDAPTTGAGERK